MCVCVRACVCVGDSHVIRAYLSDMVCVREREREVRERVCEREKGNPQILLLLLVTYR